MGILVEALQRQQAPWTLSPGRHRELQAEVRPLQDGGIILSFVECLSTDQLPLLNIFFDPRSLRHHYPPIPLLHHVH
jgi:hypothetical protein